MAKLRNDACASDVLEPIVRDLRGSRNKPLPTPTPCVFQKTMTDSARPKAFWPRQMIPPTPESFKELARDGGERLAAVSLAQIPAIPAGAKIHDNGCGSGAATTVIMASVPQEVAASISITGTDISRGAVDSYRARAASSSWPAEGLVMDADSLSFPDETFTHSFGNAMIFVGPRNNGVDAVKEMHRTLKPGGTLLLNCFGYNNMLEPIRKASRATRAGGILPEWDSFEQWTDASFIAGVVEAGGFEKEAIKVVPCHMFVNVGNYERATTLVWSMRGMPSGGWTEEDEEKWDEAVEIVRRELQLTEEFRMLDDGTAEVKYPVIVVTATK